jgi:hypothetical protein
MNIRMVAEFPAGLTAVRKKCFRDPDNQDCCHEGKERPILKTPVSEIIRIPME